MFKIEDTNVDKRILRTRQMLRQAFFELMQEKEFQQVTVQDITERATINRATFYAHFADKYELFDHAIRSRFQDHLEKEMPSADRLTYDNLYALSLATLTFFQEFIGHCAPSKRQSELPFEKQIQQHLYAVILDWLEHHNPLQIPTNTSPELVATTTSASILASVLQYARGHNNAMSPRDYIDSLMTLLMNGVHEIIAH